MASTNFVNGTVVQAYWLNDVDALTYGISEPTGAALVGANAYQTQADVNADRVSVNAFGAVGDGVADDSTAIQNALNFAAANSSLFRRVEVEANANYRCAADINIPANVVFRGGGQIKFDGAFGLVANDKDRWALRDLCIIGSGTNGQSLVYIHNTCARFAIEGCTFRGFVGSNSSAIYATNSWIGLIRNNMLGQTSDTGTAIKLENGPGNCSKGTPYSSVNAFDIRDNIIENGGVGVHMNVTDASVLQSARQINIQGGTVEGNASGIIAEGVSMLNIEGVYFEAQTAGIHIRGPFVYGLRVAGNSFWANPGDYADGCIRFAELAFNGQSIEIAANRWSLGSGQKAIIFDQIGNVTADLRNNQLQADAIQTNATTTILYSNNQGLGELHTFLVQTEAENTVTTNHSQRTIVNTGATIWTQHNLPPAVKGLRYAFRNTASGQQLFIKPTATQSIRGYPAGQPIRLATTGGWAEIECIEDGVWDVRASWGRVYDLLRFRTGTANIPPGSTSVVVTHSLGITPTLPNIHLTVGNNPTNDIGFPYVTAITATQFTVAVRNDPGASGVAVGWKVTD